MFVSGPPPEGAEPADTNRSIKKAASQINGGGGCGAHGLDGGSTAADLEMELGDGWMEMSIPLSVSRLHSSLLLPASSRVLPRASCL